jgi:transcriptional regulator with XRE-family HTH domain
MNTQNFAELRKKAGMTQAAVAEALGVTPRTICAWEMASPPRELTTMEVHAVRNLFCRNLLEEPIRSMLEEAFQAIPSELVAIWLVQEQDCILLPGAARYHDVERNENEKEKEKRRMVWDARLDMPSAQCVAPLVVESLTTYPLRTGETVNLAGEAILHHKAKKYRQSRASHIFYGKMCESLLHVPAFTGSARGPAPVLLLSLENRLREDGTVWAPKEGETRIYSRSDEDAAKKAADSFKERLLGNMLLLDMLE